MIAIGGAGEGSMLVGARAGELGRPPAAMVVFFGALFSARTDSYAVRWDNARTGQKGMVASVVRCWQGALV